MIRQIAVALGIATLGFTPGLAHAQQSQDNYPPGESLTAEATATSCVVPYEPTVSYLVVPVGIDIDPGDPVTIKLYDVNNNQIGDPFPAPLKGSFPYPGTTFDSSGEVITWPGWVLENGTWVETASAASTIWRKGITVEFGVGLSTSVLVTYPDDNPNCGESGSAPPNGGGSEQGNGSPAQRSGNGSGSPAQRSGNPTQAGPLPSTGTNSTQLFLQIGLLLLVGGGITMIATHRRRSSSAPA